jgi:hypothetical protein
LLILIKLSRWGFLLFLTVQLPGYYLLGIALGYLLFELRAFLFLGDKWFRGCRIKEGIFKVSANERLVPKMLLRGRGDIVFFFFVYIS